MIEMKLNLISEMFIRRNRKEKQRLKDLRILKKRKRIRERC